MDFSLTPEIDDLRLKVRAFVAENVTEIEGIAKEIGLLQ